MENYNCKNCGAPLDLHKYKCDYCGTFFQKPLFYFDSEEIKLEAIKDKGLPIGTFSTACCINTRMVNYY